MSRGEAAVQLKDRLLTAVPAVREVYEAHLAEHPEFDAQEFFSDLALWVNARFIEAQRDGLTSGAWRDVLDFLEREFAYAHPRRDGDPDCDVVDELIDTYFDIFLAKQGRPGREVREYLGPEMGRPIVPPPTQAEIDAPRQLADRMVRAVPACEPVYREHVEFMGYASSLLFGSELVSWAVDRFVESRQRGETTGPWRDLLDFFEREYAEAKVRYSFDEVAMLVDGYIGEFVDSLPKPGQRGAELGNYLGPHLRGTISQ